MTTSLDPLVYLLRIISQQPPKKGYWEKEVEPSQRYLAAATYFVLAYFPDRQERPLPNVWDKEPRYYQSTGLISVEAFVTQVLRRILEQLNRRTERRQIQYRGQVRGRVVWPATYKARTSEGYDPSLFVCQEVQRQYDTLENQLLKYVVTQIDECLKVIPEVIRSGYCYNVVTNNTTLTEQRLACIESSLAILRRNVRLREIHLPKYITEEHLLSARTSRQEEYALVADFYCHYRDTVLSHTLDSKKAWKHLSIAGQRVVPLPVPSKKHAFWYNLGAAILLNKGSRSD